MILKDFLKSSDWNDKSEAFEHFAILDLKDKSKDILPYLKVKSRNKHLRSNALIALISLAENNFDLLNEIDFEITKADEIKILNIIYEKDTNIPLHIENWLQSQNNSTVSIAIKLAVRFKYEFTTIQLVKLLHHQNFQIRRETLKAIDELNPANSCMLLTSIYERESYFKNKLLILKTFQKSKSNLVKKFLQQLFLEEQNVDLKFEIVNALQLFDKNFINTITNIDHKEREIIQQMLLHNEGIAAA